VIAILRTTAATADIYGKYSVTARVDGEEVTRDVVFVADHSGVRIDCGDGRVVPMTWSALHAAAEQSDEVAAVYRSILALSEQRRDHFDGMAEHAKLLSDALSGRATVYVSAEQDSTNVWWVSVVRAGNDGYASARPLSLRSHPSKVYHAEDGGTHATAHLARLEAEDIARRVRDKFPSARVVVPS